MPTYQSQRATYEGFCKIIVALQSLHLLNDRNFDYNFLAATSVMLKLLRKSWLNKRNFVIIALNPDATALVVDKFLALPPRCLTAINFDFVVTYSDPVRMINTLSRLSNIRALSTDDWNNIHKISGDYLRSFTNSIVEFHHSRILDSFTIAFLARRMSFNEATLNMIAAHPHPTSLANAFIYLKNHFKIVDDEIWAKVAEQNTNFVLMLQAFDIIRKMRNPDNRSITQEIVSRVISHEDPNSVCQAFLHLHDAGILQSKVYEVFTFCKEPGSFDERCAQQLSSFISSLNLRMNEYLVRLMLLFGVATVALIIFYPLEFGFIIYCAAMVFGGMTQAALILVNEYEKHLILTKINDLASQNNPPAPTLTQVVGPMVR